VPSAAGAWAHPLEASQLSIVHSFWSSQSRGVAPAQVPDSSHWSVKVQASPSSQVLAVVVDPQNPLLAAPAAMLQAWQSFVALLPQGVSQHTPSAQEPEAHSAAPSHGSPSPFPSPSVNT
jgi:hypothetical protein